MFTARQTIALAAALLISGCATSVELAPTPSTHSSQLNIGSGTYIGDENIGAAHGSVLNNIQSRVAGMRLRRGIDCPEISFRGPSSVMMNTEPLVYISGQRALNTCVLENLNSDDVASIEVYPGGVSRRAGYQTSPAGLILVFMKDGSGGY